MLRYMTRTLLSDLSFLAPDRLYNVARQVKTGPVISGEGFMPNSGPAGLKHADNAVNLLNHGRGSQRKKGLGENNQGDGTVSFVILWPSYCHRLRVDPHWRRRDM
ncbi:hypothetical protein PoB_001422600 [Plakobranchus ocellatus]|uniref:Uncharacterized protein n=1 Tax=Plakobranchus ocellatus TaxID=259542 RepID=A0AAV3YW55_9GAST|nr:hypothetical protein PoB_001422600 [Plakobranchus ocellatus]